MGLKDRRVIFIGRNGEVKSIEKIEDSPLAQEQFTASMHLFFERFLQYRRGMAAKDNASNFFGLQIIARRMSGEVIVHPILCNISG